jgi:hypothetical protein
VYWISRYQKTSEKEPSGVCVKVHLSSHLDVQQLYKTVPDHAVVVLASTGPPAFLGSHPNALLKPWLRMEKVWWRSRYAVQPNHKTFENVASPRCIVEIATSRFSSSLLLYGVNSSRTEPWFSSTSNFAITSAGGPSATTEGTCSVYMQDILTASEACCCLSVGVHLARVGVVLLVQYRKFVIGDGRYS